MTPGRYAKGGAGLLIRYAITNTAIGLVLVAATDRGVCAVLLGLDHDRLRAALSAEFSNANLVAVEPGADSAFAETVEAVRHLINTGATDPALALDPSGTPFQLQVWGALLEIPVGETRSYRDIAAAIGQPRAVRAVANAVGSNRLAVVVPCHRVVRHDGGIGGYRWGADTKRRLLDRERTAGSA